MQIQNELDFIIAIDALKNVERRNFNADDQRRENTAEHSWQIIIFAQILYPYARQKQAIDLLRVIRMLSIHDLVEIAVGDTFIFDDKRMEGKYEREKQAAEQLFGSLPGEAGNLFLELWLEFEERNTPDAIFANAVDRLMPFVLNSHTSGKSWREAMVNEIQVRKRLENAIAEAGAAFEEVFHTLLAKNIADGKILAAHGQLPGQAIDDK